MIKGKYTAIIEAEFHIDETLPGVLSFEEIRKRIDCDSITHHIHNQLMDYLFDSETTTLKITPSTCYVFKEKDNHE